MENMSQLKLERQWTEIWTHPDTGLVPDEQKAGRQVAEASKFKVQFLVRPGQSSAPSEDWSVIIQKLGAHLAWGGEMDWKKEVQTWNKKRVKIVG